MNSQKHLDEIVGLGQSQMLKIYAVNLFERQCIHVMVVFDAIKELGMDEARDFSNLLKGRIAIIA